jgi:hypothetical protein
LKIITFYADANLPDKAKRNQEGFDWRKAILMLEKSAARFGYKTLLVTDRETEFDAPWLRTGDAKHEGIMHWLLGAQAAAMLAIDEPAILVSPDTLIYSRLDFLFGSWDIALLTRQKPKPIVNSVIAFKPSYEVFKAWCDVIKEAESLPPESIEWGADIDAVVNVFKVAPLEARARNVAGVRAMMIPTTGIFQSAPKVGKVSPMPAAIWDFKGGRKARMTEYARLINADI